MSKKTSKTLAMAISTALVGSLAAAGMAQASENPFEVNKLSSGYTTLAGKGKCGEGKCGEGKCGAKKKAKKKDGKCGEGKCGGKK